MPSRKQAAVMFTDVVGFTSLMERSEDKAMRVLSQKMAVVRKALASRDGKLVKEMGDGTLSVFSHTPNAVSAAMDIQNSLCSRNFKVRIGIHYGSVLFESGDIFGDTVNVASRLESKAPGGGILLSREVLSQYKESDRPETVDMGLTRLKGLGRLLQIHFLGPTGVSPERESGINPVKESGSLVLSVFPLANIGEADDEFYAYGISADLLSDLSKANSMSVVPVTSLIKSMRSGESKDDIARRFGSSSFVQGTIERTGSQIKLSLTLKEVKSGRTVWMDSWIEEIDDLPAIKGKLADGILKALGRNPDEYPGIAEVEVESTSTYEKYLQALHLWQTKSNKQHIQQARDLLEQVIAREPDMIPARIVLGATYRDSGEFAESLKIFRDAQEIALAGNNSSDLLSIIRSIGVSHWMKGDLDAAQTANSEAMKLAIKLRNKTQEASLLNNTGLIDCDRSLFSESLVKLKKSLAMSRELGSRTGQAHSLCNIGLVHWRSGNGMKAIEFYKKSLQIVTVIRDRAGEASLLTNIGIIYNDRGDVEQSYTTVLKSMRLSEELNDKRSICMALNNMGSAMLSLGQNREAEKHFSRALSLAKLRESFLQTLRH
ncbi:MAG: tetratricopeptide repeat protein [Candidatus Sabulitectum sp.]|nr:tetratricopeptide repeat protein [Candidatus Sabulitectum sp.]